MIPFRKQEGEGGAITSARKENTKVKTGQKNGHDPQKLLEKDVFFGSKGKTKP